MRAARSVEASSECSDDSGETEEEAGAAHVAPAAEGLHAGAIAEAKGPKVYDLPELFAAYHALAEQARGVVDAHVQELTGQLARIVASGCEEGPSPSRTRTPPRGGSSTRPLASTTPPTAGSGDSRASTPPSRRW